MRRRERGFTLLELLLAVALLAVVAAALYGTFFTIMKGRERATGGMENRRELAQTMDRLRRELAATIVRGDNTTGNGFFVVEDKDVFGKPASTLFFTALTVPPGDGSTPRSDQMKVQYKVVEKDDRMVLTREEGEIVGDAKPIPYPQMEEIESFLVECYDGSKWVKTWNTQLVRKIPAQVRVTLTVKEEGKPVSYTATATPQVAQ